MLMLQPLRYCSKQAFQKSAETKMAYLDVIDKSVVVISKSQASIGAFLGKKCFGWHSWRYGKKNLPYLGIAFFGYFYLDIFIMK